LLPEPKLDALPSSGSTPARCEGICSKRLPDKGLELSAAFGTHLSQSQEALIAEVSPMPSMTTTVRNRRLGRPMGPPAPGGDVSAPHTPYRSSSGAGQPRASPAAAPDEISNQSIQCQEPRPKNQEPSTENRTCPADWAPRRSNR